jgi:hypothetical protein
MALAAAGVGMVLLRREKDQTVGALHAAAAARRHARQAPDAVSSFRVGDLLARQASLTDEDTAFPRPAARAYEAFAAGAVTPWRRGCTRP